MKHAIAPAVEKRAGQRMRTTSRLVFAALIPFLPASIAAQAVDERVEEAVPDVLEDVRAR
jgi:hypothetical protein